MSAYAVALVKVKNPEKMQEYAKLAGPSIAKYDGEVATKGQVAGLLTGEADLNSVAVIKFDSVERINEWYGSDEYQAAIPIRDEACDMTLLKLQVPPAS